MHTWCMTNIFIVYKIHNTYIPIPLPQSIINSFITAHEKATKEFSTFPLIPKQRKRVPWKSSKIKEKKSYSKGKIN